MASNPQLLSWPIVPRARAADRARALPSTLVTIAPAFRHESMPDEVALLLPTNPGPANLIEAVLNDPALCRDAMLGLFLAGPFLNLAMDGARLAVLLDRMARISESFTPLLAVHDELTADPRERMLRMPRLGTQESPAF